VSAPEEPPFPILWLAGEVHERGREAVLDRLGRFVLVGVGAEEEPAGWAFATSTMVSPALAHRVGLGFDFERGIVIPLVKRTPTFPNVILIGRSSSNDVRIDDPSVSKLHARVRLIRGGFDLEDAGSRNGTWVDDKEIQTGVAVGHGDRVRFGQRSFRVHDAADLVELLERIGPE